MSELVRFDGYELFVRTGTCTPWAGVGVITLVTLWGLGGLTLSPQIFLWQLIVILPLLGIGISMALPTYLRICFADRSYQLVTDWDWLKLRPEGRIGSFDDIDRIRLESGPGEADTHRRIELVWKNRRWGRYTLLVGESPQFEGLAERLAAQMGVRLETVSKFPARHEPGQPS